MSDPSSRVDMNELRHRIEELDRRILQALQERMAVVDSIAEAKLVRAVPIRDQPREERVLRRVRLQAVELGLDPHAAEQLYRLVMEMSVSRQHAYLTARDGTPLRVAFQGVDGAYSHLTAQRRYAGRPAGAHLTGFSTFHGAVEAVKTGVADVALLPIENTTAGSINETYDLLAEGGITINAEVISHIQHCLLALPGVALREIRTVISHPQALAQCKDYLQALPGVEAVAEFDTAGSARKVREQGDRTLAAIASESAARLFGLEVLAQGIQTYQGNYTRFVEIALEAAPCPAEAECKTSLLLEMGGRQPGALGDVLAEFARLGVNLTKLESRPSPGQPWQYRFYLDLQGHAASRPVADAIEAVRRHTIHVRVLGTYPVAE